MREAYSILQTACLKQMTLCGSVIWLVLNFSENNSNKIILQITLELDHFWYSDAIIALSNIQLHSLNQLHLSWNYVLRKRVILASRWRLGHFFRYVLIMRHPSVHFYIYNSVSYSVQNHIWKRYWTGHGLKRVWYFRHIP